MYGDGHCSVVHQQPLCCIEESMLDIVYRDRHCSLVCLCIRVGHFVERYTLCGCIDIKLLDIVLWNIDVFVLGILYRDGHRSVVTLMYSCWIFCIKMHICSVVY